MLFKFIGQHNNGAASITPFPGVTFVGDEPTDVTDPEAVRRLSTHVEFEKLDPLDHDGDGKKGGSPAGEKATRRRKKAA